MHKIRLYVVPEVQEEEMPKDVVIDDFDSPLELLPMMQRRNSRRPSGSSSSVRLNVIQKDRRADSSPIKPKVQKHIRQQLQQANKNDHPLQQQQPNLTTDSVKPINGMINKNVNNNNNNNINLQKIEVHRKSVRGLDAAGNSPPNKSVFASQKIKDLAANLQEKMVERQAKGLRNRLPNEGNIRAGNSNLNMNLCNGDDVTPRKMIRNENMAASRVGGSLLSPIFEVPSADCGASAEIGKQFSPYESKNFINTDEVDHVSNSLYRSAVLPIRRSSDGNGTKSANEITAICDGATSATPGALVKRNLINDNNNSDVIIQSCAIGRENTTCCNTGGNNSVILRRNNKLNRYREYDLEQKIEVEIKMREGSARLLAAARHRAQSLEAARALLTSNERMSAYMAELQRRKKEPSSNNKPSLPVSTARVSLSDLRVPLMWRDSDHFKNRGDYRRFAVFCLARVGTEIHDTALLCPVDRALTDVTFPDVLVFNNVPADFEVTLEIYSHILQEDLSIASTPRRIKRSIHSSISRTVGKKLAASLRDELNSGKIGPHFELMASARLTLDDTDDNIHTHDLVLNNLENKNHSLPLFGHFCCRLAAQPECVTKEACSGNVILDGRSCWARIQGFTLQAWDCRKLADEELQNPCSTVPINRETLIQPSKSSSKELRMSNTIDGAEKITTIKLESSEEAQKWVRQLVAHAKDHLRWRHAAETIQDVPSVESARNSFISNKRQGSLYDETPLIESVQSDYPPTTRPTVQEIFGLTPSTSLSSCSSTSSPPSLRSRSLSTSGSRKSGSNTLRSHWPFSNKNFDKHE